MLPNQPRFAGFHQNFMRDWQKVKDQIFYEKYGRFANREAIFGNSGKGDQSTLLDFLPSEKTVETVYKEFLHKEAEAINTSQLTSQTSISQLKKEIDPGLR
jgi:hypothetical protein